MAGPDDWDAVAKTVPALIELSAFTEPKDRLYMFNPGKRLYIKSVCNKNAHYEEIV
jgi:hypothetical protein